MNNQLSQAVQLYDQLLSQQVAQPRWRSAEPYAAAPYQGAQMGYAPPVNGYGQWAPPNGYVQAAAPNGYAQTSAPIGYAQTSPPVGYPVSAPPPQPSYFPPQEANIPAQQSWYTQHPAEQTHQASAPHASSSHTAYQTSSQTPVPQALPSPQQQHHAPASLQQFPYQTSSPTPAPTSPQQYSAPAPVQQFSSPPPPQQQQQYSAPTPTPAPPIPSTQLTRSSPVLSRQSTVSYAPSAAPQPAASLARSHTLANPHSPRTPQSYYPSQTPSQPYANQPPRQFTAPAEVPQQQQQQHQPQHHQQQQQYYSHAPSAPPTSAPVPAPSVSLSQFPVAPTSAPQAFQALYGPGTPMALPSGVVQTEERKEALLIDL